MSDSTRAFEIVKEKGMDLNQLKEKFPEDHKSYSYSTGYYMGLYQHTRFRPGSRQSNWWNMGFIDARGDYWGDAEDYE
jgi:hypothetical protein